MEPPDSELSFSVILNFKYEGKTGRREEFFNDGESSDQTGDGGSGTSVGE